MDYLADFDPDKCIKCGECFSKCPVMKLPLEKAKMEVDRLSKGQPAKYVTRKCESCFGCNFICSNRANPAQRILDIWRENGKKKGIPVRAKYFAPNCETNFRTYVVKRLPDDEKELVESWKSLKPSDEIFFPGCNIITSPYLTKSRLFENQNIRGSLYLCCGEMYFRTGQNEELKKTARRLNKWRAELGFQKMIIPCTAGKNMFANVLPQYGFKLDFEIEHFLETLLRKFKAGQLKVRNPIEMNVTIQDSCHGKFFGDPFMDIPRELLAIIGATVIEQKHSRNNALCCGIGGGFSQPSAYHPLDMTLSTLKNLRSANRSGAECIVVYCAGCLQMLSVGKLIYPAKIAVFHILELIQMAIGEKPERKNNKRAKLLLTGTVKKQFPKLFSSEQFYFSEKENRKK